MQWGTFVLEDCLDLFECIIILEKVIIHPKYLIYNIAMKQKTVLCNDGEAVILVYGVYKPWTESFVFWL